MSNFSSTANAPAPPQVQQQQVQPQQQAAPSQNQPMSFTPVSASSSVSTPVTSAVGVSAPASASIPSQSVLGGSTRSPAPPPISGNVDGAATPASTSTSVPVPSVSAPGTLAAITSASIAASVPNAQSNTSVPISSSGPAPGLAGNASASAPAATQTEPQPSNQDTFWAARREEEIARRDRSLAELLVMLDGYKPLIPEEVTEYFLQRSGFDCSDPRLKRLLSLVAQKFISDLSRDAFHFSKLRVNGATAGRGRPAAGVDRNRVVLTMDDLSLALGEHGVNLKAPDYYL
ncbi:transcription initiation factor TFIID subunit 10 [Cryptococcus neoformans var. grubii Br795]|uniref:Transcription initiation factor TFIID subunit 10 n=1 Tax=Cryptococcus neoformans Tu259-1 TaxID=1230072 RepID=A0A854QNH1_CRYNE|nr:transcription initiation factor TFIID subunit 10 [Cryptococcus neoformans var. grubii AD1-83a]OXG24973.1 transcription initiation factor TFIID subunit 10 [Cryptococcus neoformans var. grubii Tu259-1]OXG45076.1 transcription initiation factor TFIID subunit 10 [Cryptococcus neoformans var. grubii Th84]OXG51521.1 transcription initiation factor TFIID subunit 10 [Cryptococcus neoformans var. grubii CHC193]OXG57816.1 transcription initiation factor TFIID subunit 10 [Cryptococcus neoformans var. g